MTPESNDILPFADCEATEPFVCTEGGGGARAEVGDDGKATGENETPLGITPGENVVP